MVTYHSRIPAPQRPKPDPVLRERFLGFTAGRLDKDGILIGWERGTIRLLVFQPGTTSAERLKVAVYCWLRYHTGNAWLVIAIFSVVLFGPVTALPVGLIWRLLITGAAGLSATLALTGIAWVLARRTLATAHGIACVARTERLAEPRGRRIYETRIVAGDKELFEEYSTRLAALEAAELSPVEYEREWTLIYNDLAAITTSSAIQRAAS